jgi:transposase
VSKPLKDTLWETIAPLLPPEPPKPTGGQSRGPDHAALSGILFVLKSGIPWAMVLQELGCGRGVTCWWRRRAWQKAGVWERLLHAFLERLGAADQSDWHRASADSARLSVSALERHS